MVSWMLLDSAMMRSLTLAEQVQRPVPGPHVGGGELGCLRACLVTAERLFQADVPASAGGGRHGPAVIRAGGFGAGSYGSQVLAVRPMTEDALLAPAEGTMASCRLADGQA